MAWTIEMLKSLRRREDGQDLLEYALLISLIALVAAGAVAAAGGAVDTIFTDIAGSI